MKRIKWEACVSYGSASATCDGIVKGSILRLKSGWSPDIHIARPPIGHVRFKRRVDAKRWVECQLQKPAVPQPCPF